MSSIFDNVDIATSRRKNKVLDTGQMRDIFGGHGTSHVVGHSSTSLQPTCTMVYTNTQACPPEIQHLPSNTQMHPQGGVELLQFPSAFKLTSNVAPSSVKIDIFWAGCVICSLIPVFSSVYSVVVAPSFSANMLAVPYQCNLFYFGLFCGLPGITVHIFCLSLIFHQLCRSGVILSLMSTFFMIMAIEHACMTEPSVSTDVTFYLMALSVYTGLVAQGFFVSILYAESKQRQLYVGALGVAFVLVTLSILSIALSMLNSETPHTKPTVLVRIVPLSAAVIIYCMSTYWTLYPVRVVCNNM